MTVQIWYKTFLFWRLYGRPPPTTLKPSTEAKFEVRLYVCTKKTYKSNILHAKFKFFPPKIVFKKKFLDIRKIVRQCKKYFKLKFLKLKESDDFERSEVASLEWLFRGDLNDTHYSFEHDLSLFIWPPHSSVQSCVTVPL